MKLEIISMTPQERMYSYSQSSQIEAQTGCIGHLRGDFGAGQEFFTSWFEHRGEYKTDEFKAEFDEVVNSLREKNGLLFSRDSMIRYCRQRPEAEMVGNYCTEYGFKLKTVQHTYMLRCNPNYGDYNFYLYAYVGRFLEHHMEKAQQGIRFITPGYKEIFRIPDGDSTAFSLVEEKPVTESVGLSTKPTLKSPAVIPTPFIISVSLRNVWRKPTEVSFHCVLLCRLTVSAFSLPAES